MKPFGARNLLAGFALIAAGVLLLYAQQTVEAEPPKLGARVNARDDAPAIDPTVLKDKALAVLETYCVSCHGPDKQKGGVRLDALETIEPVELQELYASVKELVHFQDMPPAKAKQPSEAERQIFERWLDSQLTGDAAKALAEKLKRFEYGNVVDHEDLFSGAYADLPAYTEDRRWLISEFIFNEKINRLLDDRPTRTIYGQTRRVAGDSGIHWSPKSERGDKFRRSITNPFLLPTKVGVRYSGHDAVTAGHLLTMLGNAKRIAEHMSAEATMKSQYPAMHALMRTELRHRETLRTREAFLTTDGVMPRLLKDLYGDEHEKLLPELVRKEIPYPGPPKHKSGAATARQTNLGLIDRLDAQDVRAIYRGIAAYKRTPYDIETVDDKALADDKGRAVWAPYSDDERAEYDRVIEACERDWFVQGVSDYRITNRITTMKLFFDQWDLAAIYKQVKAGGHHPSKYKPLNESEMARIADTIKAQRERGDTYQAIIDKCLAVWRESMRAERDAAGPPGDDELGALVDELYERIFERRPAAKEREKNIALLRSYLAKLERQQAIAKLIESLVLKTEFVYRDEFGQGEADAHGRRMMSPRDASYAIAYALTDSSPDAELVKAVEEGRLSTRQDYEREVRRMLKRRDQWTVIDEAVQAANLNASVTNQPIRKLRFFREFFGYPKAMKVFKDDHRFGAGRHEQAVSRLVDEADMLVEHILEQDRDVFEQLLTTDKFYVFHNGDGASMQAASDELKSVYQRFKDKDWRAFKPEDLTPHMAFLKNVWEFKKTRGGDEQAYLKTLQRMMPALELHFGEGQDNAMPYMKMPMGFWHGGSVLGRTGQQMRGEQVTTYWNIDWRTWDYPTHQPAAIANRKGILTHPAWLIAHAQNLETDPIHRGKWVREKLLAGTIPDVPITVDAVIHPDKDKTLRQRMEDRTGDAYCWRCHQKMDPLGFPFEHYDDFGRYRTEENLEHPDNLIKESKRGETNAFGATLPVYKTLPVDPTGVLNGTGDPALDGEVDDAFDLIDRLAKSDKVRQSVIRHAFRYFMGRNETLADSKTLIDADRAYLDSGGSFDEVIVSLLTSDSFIYRKPAAEE
jgi:mono/diheme cytochrome c family protein